MSLPPDSHAAPADVPPGSEARVWLSAAADGDAQAVGTACRAWRDQASARATWHTYHLIGDVLRSGELAAEPARDAAFLQGLRRRLAAEPVVLRPTLPQARRSTWLWPSAAAAGFVVAGVLVASRWSAPQGAADPALAAASVPAGLARVGAVAPAAPRVPVEGTLIRDARLDEYLRAHQAARGGSVVSVRGGGLRQVDAELPAGAPR